MSKQEFSGTVEEVAQSYRDEGYDIELDMQPSKCIALRKGEDIDTASHVTIWKDSNGITVAEEF